MERVGGGEEASTAPPRSVGPLVVEAVRSSARPRVPAGSAGLGLREPGRGLCGCSWALHAGAQARPPPCLPEVIQRVSRPESLAGCPFWDLLICLQSPGCSPPVSEGCGAEVPSRRLGSAPDPEAPAWRWGCRILPAGGWLCHCGARGTGEHGGRVLGAGGPSWGSDPAAVYGLLCSCFGGWRARMCAWRQPCIGGARSWSSGGGWCDWLPSLSRP